jgi:hypothetical protein
MKKTLFLIGIILSANAFAYRTTSYNGSFQLKSWISEADVVSQAEALIPSIVSFKNKMVRKEAAYNDCTRGKRNIKLGRLTVKKVYTSSDNISFEPIYLGRLGYKLTNCRESE